MVKAKIADQLL